MPSFEKFNRTLKSHAISSEVVKKIYAGFESLSEQSPRNQKRAFFRQAMEVLDHELPREAVVSLMEENCCCIVNSAREKASKAFAKANADKSIEERVPLISSVRNMGTPSLAEDGKLYILAVQYFKDGLFRCPCPTINTNRKSEEPLSRTYCMCCAGHFRFHYQIMLDCSLKLEKVKTSPLDSNGAEPCSFVFEIIKYREGINNE